tara:strand:+ start:13578 stop:14672 length:1095 start_codon:yes stop_codon:yes gene_type:complete
MLEIRGLSKHYGTGHGLHDLSLDVTAGEVLCVLGPSGCGKSTLLKLVSGLEAPDAGSIHIGGRRIAGPGFGLPPEKRPVNMVFQDYALWPHMRVRAIVGYGLNRLPRPQRERRVDGLLAMLRLTAYANRYPRELSGGQQQRVAIARALATEPEVLLFDEPLSNLDVQLRQDMRHELAELFRDLGKTVLYVTHDPLEACAFGHRLLVLRQGRLEQLGETRTLFETPASPWVAALAGYDSRLRAEVVAQPEAGLCMASVAGQALTVRLRGEMAVDPGTPLSVMLHSTDLRIDGAGDPADSARNTLSARVVQCIFEGRAWRLRLDLAGERLSLLSPDAVDCGTLLRVRFPVADTLGFAIQAEGPSGP